MKVKDKDDARHILQEIDVLSESATLMNDTLSCLKQNGGKAKLTVCTDGKVIVTELDAATASIVMREIIGTYNNLITVNKSNLEVIIRNTIVTTN